MVIKPLEKKNNYSSMAIKLGFLTGLLILGFVADKVIRHRKIQTPSVGVPTVLSATTKKVQGTSNNIIGQVQDMAGQVLGNATSTITSVASDAASSATNFLIDSATQPLVDQIKKLPQADQEQIKKNICN